MNECLKSKFLLKLFYTTFVISFLITLSGIDLELIWTIIVIILASTMIIWWVKDPYPIGEFINDKDTPVEDKRQDS